MGPKVREQNYKVQVLVEHYLPRPQPLTAPVAQLTQCAKTASQLTCT